MKRIVILCDGTWSRCDAAQPTNVVRLGQALAATGPDGVAQVPIYVSGVGAGEGASRMARGMDRVLGGALGWGLLANVAEAYRHLVFLHEPGDEIFVVGFSRGAFTARSLTGLIRSTGIVGRDALHRIPEAVRRYRTMGDPATHPSSPESHAYRAAVSPRVATDEREVAWRRRNGQSPASLLRIAFLGVWDTVGALGVPATVPLLGRWTARRHRFHDAELSGMVRSARHAVALDERRGAFTPTRWSNLAALNAGWAEGSGGGSAKVSAKVSDRGTEPPYRELFFSGDHGSVGGGGDVTALSSIALGWIMEGAAAAGLVFEPVRLEAIRAEADPMGPLRSTSRAPSGLLDRLLRLDLRDRAGPSDLGELHPSVPARWAAAPARPGALPYRPGSLRAVHDQLLARAGFQARTDPQEAARAQAEAAASRKDVRKARALSASDGPR